MREVAKAFEALGRSIKRISSYRHARGKFGEYLQPAWQELDAVLAREGELLLEVQPTSLLLHGEPVLTEPLREASLCHRLYQGGVRALRFQRGLTEDEMLSFSRIAMPDGIGGHLVGREDAVIELWKADLPHLSYESVDVYEVARTEADRATLTGISVCAQATLQAAGGRSAAEDDVYGALPLLVSVAERTALDPEAGTHRLQRAALVVLRVIERHLAGRDLESLGDTLGRLMDGMLFTQDAPAVATLLEKVRGLDETAAVVRKELGRRMGEAWRLEELARLCDESMDLFMFGLPVWLSLVPPEAGAALVEAMSASESKGLR